MSGIAPPRAPADAIPALPHVSEKIDTRQDLKWCVMILAMQPCGVTGLPHSLQPRREKDIADGTF
ncbi:hypothetical protein NKJ06_26935 [Mesorhizobium sp. M0293]|uniref:hypothetical protein n=1 Tax=unclassified Mesorhizobium TaxID=325217 RepID=UPI0033374905